MGIGDPKTKRGKIFRHSYGKYRKRKAQTALKATAPSEEIREMVSEEDVAEVTKKVEKKVAEKVSKAKKPAPKKAKKENPETENSAEQEEQTPATE